MACPHHAMACPKQIDSRMSKYSEDAAIEQPAIELFQTMGWETINAYDEVRTRHGVSQPPQPGHGVSLGRETRDEVVLRPRLLQKLQHLNPGLPEEQIQEAMRELSRDRSSMHAVRANKQLYTLMRDGIDVEYRD